MTDEARALAIVAALLSGASGSAGFVGGRMSAPVPPAEVRFVALPVPALPAEVEPIEPAPSAVPMPPVSIEPPAASTTPDDIKPLPAPRPKVEARPKEQPKPKPRPAALKKSLPSCAAIKREYATMSWAQQMAAYRRATAEEIAYGRRCLGM